MMLKVCYFNFFVSVCLEAGHLSEKDQQMRKNVRLSLINIFYLLTRTVILTMHNILDFTPQRQQH